MERRRLPGRRERGPDSDRLSFLGLRARRTQAAPGADSGGNRGLPCATEAAPRASVTARRRDRQSQVAGTARRVPELPAGDRRRPRAARAPQPSRWLYPPSGDKLFPEPILAFGPNLSRVAFTKSSLRRACTSRARCRSAEKAEARGRARRTEAPGRSPRSQRAARAQVSAPSARGSAILLLLFFLLFLLLRCRRLSLAYPRPALRSPGPTHGRPRGWTMLNLLGPPLTWARSPTLAPAPRAQGEDPGRRPRGSGRSALPGTAFALCPTAEPSPGAGPGMQERRPGARLTGASGALHGPRLPSSEKSRNQSPLRVPGSQEPGALDLRGHQSSCASVFWALGRECRVAACADAYPDSVL